MSEPMGEEATEFVSDAPAAVADPPAEQPEPETTEPTEEAAPEFDPQQAYNELAQRVEQIPEQLASYFQQAQQPQDPGLPDLDPYDPQSVVAYIEARDNARDQQFQQMLAPIVEQHQSEQAAQFVDQVLDHMQVPNDPVEGQQFSERDMTLYLSAGFRHQGLDPRQSLAAANDMLKRYGEARYKAGRAGQVQDLEALRQAPESPQAQGSNGAVQARQPAQSLEESARAISARLGITD